MDNLAVGSGHGVQCLRLAGLDHLGRHPLRELLQSGGAAEPVAAHVHRDPYPMLIATVLDSGAGQLLKCVDGGSARADQQADVLARDVDTNAVFADLTGQLSLKAEASHDAAHKFLRKLGLCLDAHLFLLGSYLFTPMGRLRRGRPGVRSSLTIT